jgi:hypothetical protein
MQSEVETPRPLQAEEIKDGLTTLIAEAVRARLDKSCSLYGQSYPKFSAEITICLKLDDFGRMTEDNHSLTVAEGEPGPDAVTLDASFTVPEQPPNQFRMETDQAITKAVVEDGKVVEKRVKYQARGKK